MSTFASKNPDFLMTLGKVYLNMNLLEAAEEALTQIKEEDDRHYVDANKLLLEVYYRRGNFQEVIRLGESLMKKSENPKWLSYEIGNRVGASYYQIGEIASAKQHLLKHLDFLPDISQVRARIESCQRGSEHPKVKRLIKECSQIMFTPHVLLDCITPLLWEVRSATCCFVDQLFIPYPHEKILLAMVEYLYCRFGIYTAFLRYSPGDGCVLGKVYFSKNSILLDEVAEIERLAWKEFEEHSEESNRRLYYMEREAILLGYPSCCVQWALDKRRSGKSIEDEALTALIAEDCACSMEESKSKPLEFAYFAYEFYPCAPRCERAEKVGKDILARYSAEDTILAEFYYNYILPLNKAKIWDRPPTQYKDFIVPFNEQIYSASQTALQKFYAIFKRWAGRFKSNNDYRFKK